MSPKGSNTPSFGDLSKAAGAAGFALDTSHHFTLCGLSPVVIAMLSSICWMACSSGLILLNKDLLSHGFPYPMALSALGMGFSGAASYLVCRVFKFVEAKRVVTPRFYITRILPVGLFTALTLMFGNLVYLYLTVAFIQMLKAFTPVMTMVALFVAGLETPTRRLVASVVIIATGTVVASAGEVNLSWLGLSYMLASEGFEAVRLVMTQLLLTGLKFHPIEGLMYLAPASFFWLALGSAAMELRPMLAAGAPNVVAAMPLKFAAAAAMGFGVNSLGYIIIQSSSALTLKVLGTVKNALVVWIGIAFLHEKVTLLQGGGYLLSMAAFAWYNKIKMERAGGGVGSQPATPRNGMRQYSNGASPKYEALPVKDVELAEGKDGV